MISESRALLDEPVLALGEHRPKLDINLTLLLDFHIERQWRPILIIASGPVASDAGCAALHSWETLGSRSPRGASPRPARTRGRADPGGHQRR
jgi:hypothetical protein